MYIHTLQPTLQTTETGKGERARESEREPARVRETEREGERERRTQTKPSSSSQTADNPPSPLWQNTTRLMQQQVQYCQAEAASEKVHGAEQDCWQINSLAPAGSTFLISVTGCWNALFQTVHRIIINRNIFIFFLCILA